MHLFDADDKLKKYEKIEEIIDDYYRVRLSIYDKRKRELINLLEKELIELSNKARYIIEIVNNTIDLRNKKSNEVSELLKSRGYTILEEDEKYSYLVKMPMDSVTEENVAKLLKSKQEKECELEMVRNTSIQQMWRKELDVLEKEYNNFIEERKISVNQDENDENGLKKTKKAVRRITSKK